MEERGKGKNKKKGEKIEKSRGYEREKREEIIEDERIEEKRSREKKKKKRKEEKKKGKEDKEEKRGEKKVADEKKWQDSAKPGFCLANCVAHLLSHPAACPTGRGVRLRNQQEETTEHSQTKGVEKLPTESGNPHQTKSLNCQKTTAKRDRSDLRLSRAQKRVFPTALKVLHAHILVTLRDNTRTQTHTPTSMEITPRTAQKRATRQSNRDWLNVAAVAREMNGIWMNGPNVQQRDGRSGSSNKPAVIQRPRTWSAWQMQRPRWTRLQHGG